MISKSDWNAVNDEVTAEARRKLGDPPTYEEVLAYSRGELSPAEEERVRDLLVAYPEMARVMFADAPEDDAKPGEPGYVSDAEMAMRYTELEQRIGGTAPARSNAQSGRVVVWRRYAPVALAAMLVVVSGLYLQAAMKARRLTDELNQPRVSAEERMITSDSLKRGGYEDATLTATADTYTVSVAVDANYLDFRLELIDYATQRSVWKSGVLHRDERDQTFSIFLKRSSMPPGEYQIVVYGVAAGREEKLDTHTFAIPRTTAPSR